LTYLAPDSRAARVADQLLDLLLVATLLAAPLVFYTKGYDVFEFNKITILRALCSLAAATLLFKLQRLGPAGAGLAGGLPGGDLPHRELAPVGARRVRGF
jgi:hypothetical protein